MAFDPYMTNPYFQAQYPGMYQMPSYAGAPNQPQAAGPQQFTSIMTGTPQFGLGSGGFAEGSQDDGTGESAPRGFDNNFGGVDIGRAGRVAMQFGSHLPGIGPAIGLAGLGMRANNLAAAHAAIKAMGGEGLGWDQVVGGALGLNDYGTGNYGQAVRDNMRAKGRSVPMSTGRPPNRSAAQLAAQRGGGGGSETAGRGASSDGRGDRGPGSPGDRGY
jgi:hypothetical protein